MKPLRLDAELVRRGLVATRMEARRAIEEGKVSVRGIRAARPAARVAADAPIALVDDGPRFVSRGGDKLEGALRRLDVPVDGRLWLDAGASTGGFTDCLLRAGAARVLAIDVGYGQLDWRLRNDPRVVVMERTNVRYLERDMLPWAPQGVVADLSFISLTLVLPALASVARDDADFVLLVKPQFEAGRDAVGRRGVVREPAVWRATVERVADAAGALGLGLAGAAVSEVPGPAGNREFFVHVRRGARGERELIARAVADAAP